MLCKKIIKVYQFKITNIVGTCITDITLYLILIDITWETKCFLSPQEYKQALWSFGNFNCRGLIAQQFWEEKKG